MEVLNGNDEENKLLSDNGVASSKVYLFIYFCFGKCAMFEQNG
jgi:hypothetical protein